MTSGYRRRAVLGGLCSHWFMLLSYERRFAKASVRLLWFRERIEEPGQARIHQRDPSPRPFISQCHVKVGSRERGVLAHSNH
jgi:hypothetical protein